jgi:hypothetical protein
VTGTVLQYLDTLEWEVGFDQQLTVVLPEFVPVRWWHFVLHNQTALMLKAALFFRRRAGRWVAVVTDVPYYLGAKETPVPWQAAAAHRDPLIVGLAAAVIVALLGYVLAAVLGWSPVYEETFGVAAFVLLVATAVAWFVRAPHP